MKYNNDRPLRVFTTFSGYDSQCLALKKAGIPFELVGWSEIEKRAIDAHNILFPQYSDKNYGDICKIDWSQVPDFDFFTRKSKFIKAIDGGYDDNDVIEKKNEGKWEQYKNWMNKNWGEF